MMGRKIKSDEDKNKAKSLKKELAELRLENDALRRRLDHSHALLEASPDSVVIYTPDGQVLRVNSVFTETFGWTGEELAGRRLDFVPEENMPETIEAVKQLGREGKAKLPDTKRLTKDGRILDIQGNSHMYRDRHGNPAGSVVVLRDITEKKAMAEKMRENQEKFHSVMEAAPDAIVIYNEEGKVTYLNPAFTTIFGWTSEELLNKRIDFVPEENLPETIEAIKRIKQGEKIELVTRRRAKDDRVLDIHLSSATFSDRAGNLAGTVVILRDISEKIRNEAAARKSGAHFRSVMEAAPDAVVIYDTEEKVSYLNPAFTAMFGWTQDELLDRRIDFVPEENMPETIEAVKRLLKEGQATLPDTKRLTKDGRVLDIHGSSYLFADNDGNPAGSVVVLRDISEKKHMENAIKEGEDKFQSIMEATPDAIVIYTPQGKVSYLNPAFTRIFGWSMDELVDQRIDFVPEDCRRETSDALQRMINGEKIELETRRFDKSGRILDIHLSSSMFFDHKGNSAGSVVILRDITEKKETAQKENEKRFRLVTETMPVPIIVSRQADGVIIYANKHASRFFNMSLELLGDRHMNELFDTPVLDLLDGQGTIMDHELTGSKGDGSVFWTALSMQPIRYRQTPCHLGVLFDLTERKLADQEIKRLQEELKSKLREKEGKYLTFEVASEIFGVSLEKIRKIMEMRHVTPIPKAPEFLKGYTEVGGRLTPVIDLSLKLGMDSVETNGRTCIIVVELGQGNNDPGIPTMDIGMIVNSVSEVLDIRGEEVEDPPVFGMQIDTEYIYGMAKIDDGVKILLNIDRIFSKDEYHAFMRHQKQ